MVKSNYHKECLIDIIKKSNLDKKISNEENEKILNIAESKIISIPNGIRIELFDSNLNTSEIIQRNPYRFCYCSCYTRGLDKIIGIIWPIIYSYEPRAELHVYYGMNGITNEQYKNYLKMLLAQPGVMDHSRQPVEIISREKSMSNFHLYLTDTISEIDCISIRESVLAGCVPIISNCGVFKERDGIHIDFDSTDEKMIKFCAVKIIDLLKNPSKVEECRLQMKNSKNIVGWKQVAQEWLNCIE